MISNLKREKYILYFKTKLMAPQSRTNFTKQFVLYKRNNGIVKVLFIVVFLYF